MEVALVYYRFAKRMRHLQAIQRAQTREHNAVMTPENRRNRQQLPATGINCQQSLATAYRSSLSSTRI